MIEKGCKNTSDTHFKHLRLNLTEKHVKLPSDLLTPATRKEERVTSVTKAKSTKTTNKNKRINTPETQRFCTSKRLEWWLCLSYLFVHDGGQFSGQVSVAGLHLVMVLLLVLFDQLFIHPQTLATGVHKLPAHKYTHKTRASGDALRLEWR